MNVICKRTLFAKGARHADAKVSIQYWFDVARAAAWQNLEDVRQDFPATDIFGKLAIFNIKGNRYRLIVRMEFQRRRVYIKEFLTHAEYDRGGWKKWLP